MSKLDKVIQELQEQADKVVEETRQVSVSTDILKDMIEQMRGEINEEREQTD